MADFEEKNNDVAIVMRNKRYLAYVCYIDLLHSLKKNATSLYSFVRLD